MTYRDDLDAAHARITALEVELDRRGGGDDDAPPDERDKLVDEIKQLRAIVEERRVKLAELRAERDQLAARVRALETESHSLPSLWDQNRSFPMLTDGVPTSVACPSCRGVGIETQLVHDAGLGIVAATSSTNAALMPVTCPRCLFVGVLRRR